MYMVSGDEDEPLLGRHDGHQTPAHPTSEASNCGGNHDSETTPSEHCSGRAESSESLSGEIPRIAAASYSFLVMGLINSSIGVMIPQLQHFYGLNDIHVSFLFLVTPLGYLLAAFANHNVHMQFGQRGIAVLAPLCQLISVCLISAHPPFSLILVSSALGAIGTGLLDGSWCAWAAGMKNANTVSGVLHGSYSFGASLGPFLASAMLSKIQRPWHDWYFFLVRSFHECKRVSPDMKSMDSLLQFSSRLLYYFWLFDPRMLPDIWQRNLKEEKPISTRWQPL